MIAVFLDFVSKAIHFSYVFKLLIVITVLLLLISCTPKQDISPPTAKIIPKADTLHGDIRIDNYYWLHDKSNPEVIEYLEAENKGGRQAL